MTHVKAIDAGVLELTERRPRGSSFIAKMFGDRHGRESRPLLEALCGLPLPSEMWDRRRFFVANLPATGPDKVVLNAWVVLTEAAYGHRELADREVEIVQAAIDIEIPSNEPLIQTSRRSFTVPAAPPTPAGIGSVLLLAVRHLAQLSGLSPERIYRASMRVTGAEHDAVARTLRKAGVDTTPWRDTEAFTVVMEALNDQRHDRQFLEDIASLDEDCSVATLTKTDRWSLKDVGDLVHASGYLSVSVGGFRTAFMVDSREVRTSWLKCVGTAYKIDIAVAAAQARYMLSEPLSEPDRPHDWGILTVPPANRRQSIEPECLTVDRQVTLIGALEANSSWIAWSAANMLAQTKPHWDTCAFFEADRSEWKPRRAMLFPLIAILASADSGPLLHRAAVSADPVYRQAAERAVVINENLDAEGMVARSLSIDDDLTVRGELDAIDPKPLLWSCNDCKTINDIEVIDCPGCEEGTRPTLKKSKGQEV